MLYFNNWLAPLLVKPTFYIGSAACIIWGLYLIGDNRPRDVTEPDGPTFMTTHYPADWHMVGVGWALVILAPLVLRLTCETIAAIFRLREIAEADRSGTVVA